MGLSKVGRVAVKGPWGTQGSGVDPDKEAKRQYDLNSIFGLGAAGESSLYGGGFRSLMDLINNPGQTDNRLYNQSIASNDRYTQQQLNQSRGNFARNGMQNSALGMAFQNAIGGAGMNRQAKLAAEDARRRENLRREDTQLLSQFIQEPRIARYANDRGIAAQNASTKAQKQQSEIAGGAALIGSLASAFCHVADELYGFASEDAILARYYMAKHADDATVVAYNEQSSRELANRIKTDDALRAEVKPIFDSFVKKAKGDFARFQ